MTMPLSPNEAVVIFIGFSALVAVGFAWYLRAAERIEEEKQVNAKKAINIDTVDALVEVMLVRRRVNFTGDMMSIYNDRDGVLREVDSLLFERGQFPAGSATDMAPSDYHRLVRTINHISRHSQPEEVKTYLRRALNI